MVKAEEFYFRFFDEQDERLILKQYPHLIQKPIEKKFRINLTLLRKKRK